MLLVAANEKRTAKNFSCGLWGLKGGCKRLHFLYLLFFLLASTAFGTERDGIKVLSEGIGSPRFVSLRSLAAAADSCDTINYACNLTFFHPVPDGFGNIEEGMRFDNAGPNPVSLKRVQVLLYNWPGSSTDTTSNCVINVYANASPDSIPGALLGSITIPNHVLIGANWPPNGVLQVGVDFSPNNLTFDPNARYHIGVESNGPGELNVLLDNGNPCASNRWVEEDAFGWHVVNGAFPGNPYNVHIYAEACAANPNQPPVIVNCPPVDTVNLGETVTYQFQAQDDGLPGGPLIWRKLYGPGSLDSLTGQFFWIPQVEDARFGAVEVAVNDGELFSEPCWAFFDLKIDDCNQNGIADSIDIGTGTSRDCDTSGIPDECEFRFVAGDVDSSSQVDLADVQYLADYIFKSGLCPDGSGYSGDVNCSRSVGLADVVYLAKYVFQGGPEPCDACQIAYPTLAGLCLGYQDKSTLYLDPIDTGPSGQNIDITVDDDFYVFQGAHEFTNVKELIEAICKKKEKLKRQIRVLVDTHGIKEGGTILVGTAEPKDAKGGTGDNGDFAGVTKLDKDNAQAFADKIKDKVETITFVACNAAKGEDGAALLEAMGSAELTVWMFDGVVCSSAKGFAPEKDSNMKCDAD
ncbi:MAG: hypothetical protein L0196_06450 [candidate division Zixibacteria bacterium]|nr:hypothetical protein [candidate division Zixibacteria bacterium]